MTKSQIAELAAERGYSISANMLKDEMIERFLEEQNVH